MAFLRIPLLTSFLSLTIKPNLSPIFHTHPLQLNPQKYREMIDYITTKLGMELKPTKG